MKTGWEIKKIKDICDKASSNIAMNKITDIDGKIYVSEDLLTDEYTKKYLEKNKYQDFSAKDCG